MRISDWSSDVCSSDLLFPVFSPEPADWSARNCWGSWHRRKPLWRTAVFPSAADQCRPLYPQDASSRSKSADSFGGSGRRKDPPAIALRSEEHTSELQSLMRISYAVFCLKKKHTTTTAPQYNIHM